MLPLYIWLSLHVTDVADIWKVALIWIFMVQDVSSGWQPWDGPWNPKGSACLRASGNTPGNMVGREMGASGGEVV